MFTGSVHCRPAHTPSQSRIAFSVMWLMLTFSSSSYSLVVTCHMFRPQPPFTITVARRVWLEMFSLFSRGVCTYFPWCKHKIPNCWSLRCLQDLRKGQRNSLATTPVGPQRQDRIVVISDCQSSQRGFNCVRCRREYDRKP